MDQAVTIDELKQKITKFNNERDWQKYHTPKNLTISISVEAAELLEHFQWLDNKKIEKYLQNPERVKEIGAEIADVIIYSLNLASKLNLDVSETILEKNKRKRAQVSNR